MKLHIGHRAICEALKTAIEVFLRLEVREMKEILERDVRSSGTRITEGRVPRVR